MYPNYPNGPIPPYVDPIYPMDYPSYARGYGRPRDFGPPPYNPSRDWDMGRGVPSGSLAPRDFGPSANAPATGENTSRFVEQLLVCSAGLKRSGEKLSKANDEKDRKEAALEGYASLCYLRGVLATEGVALPDGILGEPLVDASASRGTACREAGEYVDRMIDRYLGGSRGAGRDIGEGIDRFGSCYREIRDNLGM